jgi:hypothetical protein
MYIALIIIKYLSICSNVSVIDRLNTESNLLIEDLTTTMLIAGSYMARGMSRFLTNHGRN